MLSIADVFLRSLPVHLDTSKTSGHCDSLENCYEVNVIALSLEDDLLHD